MVVAASVLEYVAEPAAVLCECARVLRPGDVVLYTVPDLRHPVRWAEWCAKQMVGVTGGCLGNGRGSRWDGYHAYLRLSLQRHRVRWWLAVSRLAGLHPVPCQTDGVLSQLRLLAYRCVEASLADAKRCTAEDSAVDAAGAQRGRLGVGRPAPVPSPDGGRWSALRLLVLRLATAHDQRRAADVDIA